MQTQDHNLENDQEQTITAEQVSDTQAPSQPQAQSFDETTFDNQSVDDQNIDSQSLLSHPDIENHLVIDVPVIEILTDTPLADNATSDSEPQTSVESENGFASLGLSHALLKSLSDSGYTQPTPIQAQAIPPAMAGRDLLLSAQTGSGKTAAFVLPILDLIAQSQSKSRAVRALILTPTRELAQQVSDSIRRYGSHMRDLYCIPLVGGAPYTGQIRALKKGVQIIIATPGRLLDHMNDGRIDLSNLSVLVLDEADRMLDMGFSDDITRILKETPTERQTIMSSATWAGPVGKIAESFTKNPERIAIKVESAHIDEKVYFCDDFNHKNKLLESLVCDKDLQQAIVFTATKRSSEQLAERLQDWGHKACFLHGDLPQSKRNRILADVKDGKYDIVVATDVAARGIDVPAISHVFNYDLPRQVEDYVHRIGRCGRAGRTGIAINLCSRDDRSQFAQINRYLKRDMTEATVEGLEPRYTEDRYSRDSKGGNGRGRSSNGSSRPSNGRGGYSSSSTGGYKGRSDNRSGSDSRSSSDSRSDNRGGRSDSRDGGQKYSGYRGDSTGYKGSSQGDRAAQPSQERSGDDRTSHSRGDRPDQNGKMLTSHEFNFFDKKNAGRNDRSDSNNRSDRGDRPQFDRSRGDSRGDRPQFAARGDSRNDRNDRSDRPQFDRARSDSNSNSRNDRNDRSDRPQFDRSRGDSNSNDRRFAPSRDGQYARSERPSFDRNTSDRNSRPMSKNTQGYQDRKRQEGGERSTYQGENRGGFGKPAGDSQRRTSQSSGDNYARRPRQEDNQGSSRRDGDTPARRNSSFNGGSDRRDSTGKPV